MTSDLTQNRCWDDPAYWPDDGEQWSADWGGVEWEWRCTIRPRIERWLKFTADTGVLIDLGCGHGRWCPFLKKHCRYYYGIDMNEACINRCRERWIDPIFLLTDGDEIPLCGADFIFAWGTLNNASPETLSAYMKEFARVLSPTGGAFFNHCGITAQKGADDAYHLAREAGLYVSSQELHDWPRGDLSGCFTTIQREPCERRLWVNHGFAAERAAAKQMSLYYG